MKHFIDRKIEENKLTIEALRQINQELKKQKIKSSKIDGLKKWEGFTFQSSTGLTDEFSSFGRDFKKYIKNICSDKYELIEFSRGHFEVSGFIKNKETGKLVYFSISDVRFFKDSWVDNILIRTAKNEKDYTGGSNCQGTIDNLGEYIERLTA